MSFLKPVINILVGATSVAKVQNTLSRLKSQLRIPFRDEKQVMHLLQCLSLALILALVTGVSTSAHAASEKEIDYVNLGATLLKDGYIQRASEVLEKADVSKKKFDFARYYSLKGILLHKKSYPDLSNIFIEASVKKGLNNQAIYLYKAKNYWQLQDYQGVVNAIDKAGEAAKKNQQMFVIKAEAFKQMGDFGSAWNVLDEGISRFPDFSRFYSQKFYYLSELGFFQRAVVYAKKFLDKKNHSAKDYLAISFALREAKQYDQAAALLEEAVIKNPKDDKLVELLGQIYIDQQKYLMAALVFEWASVRFPAFALKAATLYLKANQPARSLQLNRRIIDQKEKFRQRLGIDIHLDDYETLVTKEAALKRYDLIKEDNIVYALGYGYFKNGNFDKAKQLLKKIKDPKTFAKAVRIFDEIEKCKDELCF